MNKYLSLVKFSHTLFALPFALVGFTMGMVHTGSDRSMDLFFLVLICMVAARSAAMAFNRYIDRNIDSANPRTKSREIPAGIIHPSNALIFTIISGLIFMTATFFINPLCFILSPVALLIILGYSYTKRFTSLSHLVLGMGLGLAPVGAFIAATGQFHWLPIVMGASVLFWVSGFDVIYALQDISFDKVMKLKSIPVAIGLKNALLLARVFHVISAVLMGWAIFGIYEMYPAVTWLIWLAWIVFCALLIFQHTLVKPNDLSKINLAFFTSNGIASVIFGLLIISALLIR